MGSRQAGDRADGRHRRASRDLAEARNPTPRAADRRRSRARRRAQRRPGRSGRGGARRKADSGEVRPAGNHPRLPRHRRRAARLADLHGARRAVQRPRRDAQRTRFLIVRNGLGRARSCAGLDAVHLPWRLRAWRRLALERTQRPRRRGAHERRLELPPRALATGAAVTLRDLPRRRPAKRRPANRNRLVLLPRARLPTREREPRHRNAHRGGRRADDRHHHDRTRDRRGLARLLQQADRRAAISEYRQGGHARLVERGPGVCQGGAENDGIGGRRAWRPRCSN